MKYKYCYRFEIEGYNRSNEECELLAIIAQNRNIGMDHRLYKIIRTEAYQHYDTHFGINVKIYRLTAPSTESEFVGMMFFDSWNSVSHRSFYISNANGTTRGCQVWNWRKHDLFKC